MRLVKFERSVIFQQLGFLTALVSRDAGAKSGTPTTHKSGTPTTQKHAIKWPWARVEPEALS